MKLDKVLEELGKVISLHRSDRVAYVKIFKDGKFKYYHLKKNKSIWDIIYSRWSTQNRRLKVDGFFLPKNLLTIKNIYL